MNGHEVLTKVEQGYRMPPVNQGPIICPEPYYDIQLKCWNKVAETRPTFSFLQQYFDDYFVSAENSYRDASI